MKNNFSLLILILTANYLFAQVEITNYTTEDGLLSNNTSSVWVDTEDNIWFGTQDGVAKFDGTNTWSSYTKDDGLIDNNVTAICVDSDGNLWAGTDFGLSKFDGEIWTDYTEANFALLDDRITYIAESPNKHIWVGNKMGVSIISPQAGPSDPIVQFTVPFGGVTHITFGPEALISTALDGLMVYNGPNDVYFINESDGLLSNKVRAVAVDGSFQKWIASADGISVFDANGQFMGDHEYIFELPPPDKLNPVEDIKIDSKGSIWAGVYVDYLVTEGGISFLNGSSWGDYDVEDGLVGPVVRKIAIDSKDNIWVSTSTGVSKIGAVATSNSHLYKKNQVNIFPNPSADYLILESPPYLKNKRFEIQSIDGKSMKDGWIVADKQNVDLTNLKAGIYVLLIDELYQSTFIVK